VLSTAPAGRDGSKVRAELGPGRVFPHEPVTSLCRANSVVYRSGYCFQSRSESNAFMRRSRGGTSNTSRTAALPTMWMGLLSAGSGPPVEEAAIQYGTNAARPTIAPTDAARSHHHFDRNTPHAASVNNARLTSA